MFSYLINALPILYANELRILEPFNLIPYGINDGFRTTIPRLNGVQILKFPIEFSGKFIPIQPADDNTMSKNI